MQLLRLSVQPAVYRVEDDGVIAKIQQRPELGLWALLVKAD